MDLDFVSVHKNAKRELGQYPAILTSRLVNNIYLLADYPIFFNQVFTDRELTGVVLLLIVVDVVVMSLWTGVDRPRIVTVTLPSQVGQV